MPTLLSGRAAVVLLVALASCACGTRSEDGAGKPTFNYSRDGSIRLDQIQLEATHNSYHVAPDGVTNPAWAYTHAPLDRQLEDQGVRGLELDTHFNADSGVFEVYHVKFLDEGTRCRLFTDCLATIKSWSDAHPAHQTLFIHMEPKDAPPPGDPEAWLAELESEVLTVWPRDRLVTPDDVRGDAATLRDAVTKRGFPTLGETRGKMLIYVDNTSTFRDAYTHGGQDVHGRLMFSDSSPDDPFAAVRILNDPIGDQQQIADAVHSHFIVRTRADGEGTPPPPGDTTQYDAAVPGGAQIVTTDFPSADEGGGGYIFKLPDGKPSRCNPVTGPSECSAEDVENPAFM